MADRQARLDANRLQGERQMLNGVPVLIVEDEVFLAIDLASAIEDHGGTVIGPFATVADALIDLELHIAGGAILDANLLDRDVTPVAIRLIEQGVPFIVHTGTGLPDELRALHPDLPVIMKPSPMIEVVQTLIRRIGPSLCP